MYFSGHLHPLEPTQCFCVRSIGLLLSALFLLIPACGESGSGGAASGGTTPPPGFRTSDLHGDWFGTLVPELNPGDAYPFYFCFDFAGQPLSGADARIRDWASPEIYSYSNVTPNGKLTVTVVECNDLYLFTGEMDSAKLSLHGNYLMLKDGLPTGKGTFGAVLSPGSGCFDSSVQLAGTWTGSLQNARGDFRAVDCVIGSDGSVLSYLVDGVSCDFAESTTEFQFANDSVGRLMPATMKFSSGDRQEYAYFLVDEAGSRLGGPCDDAILGPCILRLVRPLF